MAGKRTEKTNQSQTEPCKHLANLLVNSLTETVEGLPERGLFHKPSTRGNKNMNTNIKNKNTQKPAGRAPQNPALSINAVEAQLASATLKEGATASGSGVPEKEVTMEEASASSTPKTTSITSSSEQPKLPKMGGAMRKRFLRLRKQGVPIDEAIEKAKIPLGPAITPATRPKSDKAKNPTKAKKVETARTPSSQPSRKRKRDITITPNQKDKKRSKTSKPSFSAVAGSVKIGVVPNDYPATKLDMDSLNNIQKKVKTAICDESDGILKPTFLCRPFIKDGYAIFTCTDKDTTIWMKFLKCWEELNLKVLEEKDFPDNEHLVGYFEGGAEDTDSDILKLIQGQNDEISTSEWQVVSRRNNKSLAILTISVDRNSKETLKKKNFILDFGFGVKVKLHQKKKKPEPKEAEQPPKEDGTPV
jgi:hypothetical protein